MKPGRLKSLLFFVLLFAVAALALDASYAQGGGQQELTVPQEHQQMITQRARNPGIGEMLADQ